MLQKTNARTLRLLDFADFLENLPDDRIDLTSWCWPFRKGCNTVGCYAGHTIYRYGTKTQIANMECNMRSPSMESPRMVAEKLLDLRDTYSPRLFTNLSITKTQAVQALRKWAFE
jgi:hypothetical protein